MQCNADGAPGVKTNGAHATNVAQYQEEAGHLRHRNMQLSQDLDAALAHVKALVCFACNASSRSDAAAVTSL
jgi:hypothetical protein